MMAAMALVTACSTGASRTVPLNPDPATYVQGVEEYRAAKDAYFKSGGSPLSHTDREKFTGLNYCPVDAKWRIVGDMERYASAKDRTEADASSGAVAMNAVGMLRFELNGQRLGMEVWQPAGDPTLMILFKDPTNGEETYEAGRYVELDLTEKGRYVLDFNMAYNPYCHYDSKYFCPFPPPENRIPVRITAGEKKLGHH
jgi:uncharacterized protein (DUF1684 family)